MNKNPLDIPEIRSRIALFVTLKDALSCVLLSKGFSQDFVYPVWHTIDLAIHPGFLQMDRSTLFKLGHHIRTIKNVSTLKQLKFLQSFKACNLSTLEVEMTESFLYHTRCYSLIRRTHGNLTNLILRRRREPSFRSSPRFLLDSLMTITQPTQPPKLTSISITSLHLTRTSFVALLRACPALTNVDVWETVFTLDQALDTFQHTGVTSIKALMKVVVMPNQPSIFIHFPNLRQWDTASSQTPDSFPTQLVKDTFSIWCPKLIEIKSNFTSSNLLVHLLVKDVFINLTALTFRYECMSEDLVQTIACYPTKWTKICCYPPSSNSGEKEDDILQRQDQFQSSGRILQLWPRLLEKLVTLDIIEHKMNIDEVEKASWSCNDLETLFVRIQGLSTKEKIDSVLMRLKEMKALQRRKSGTPVIAVRMDDHDREMSIEARVLNHLLKFKKLKYVSLGSTAWTV